MSAKTAYELIKWLEDLQQTAPKQQGGGHKTPSARPLQQSPIARRPTKRGKRGRPARKLLLDSQAGRIVAMFGGVDRLIAAMKQAGYERDRSWVYRWMYPYPKGTGGLVPHSFHLPVKCAARVAGVKLTKGDFTPTPVVVDAEILAALSRNHS